jgi:hypothetical protein
MRLKEFADLVLHGPDMMQPDCFNGLDAYGLIYAIAYAASMGLTFQMLLLCLDSVAPMGQGPPLLRKVQ